MSNFPDGTNHAAIGRWADPVEDEAAPVLVYRPLPPGMRAALLVALRMQYPGIVTHTMTDAQVAFAVQSLLDDYASPYDPADFETTRAAGSALTGKE